jgi:hypothetical protein
MLRSWFSIGKDDFGESSVGRCAGRPDILLLLRNTDEFPNPVPAGGGPVAENRRCHPRDDFVIVFSWVKRLLLHDDDAIRAIVAYSQDAGRIAGRLERIAWLPLQIGNAG